MSDMADQEFTVLTAGKKDKITIVNIRTGS